MGVGRVLCVALPFLLTVGSLIAMLVAGLAGVTNQSLYVFAVNVTDLSISTSSLTSLISERDLDIARRQGPSGTSTSNSNSGSGGFSDSDLLASATAAAAAAAATATSASDAISSVTTALSGTNVTAADLGLSDVYYINLWNYCNTISTGGVECKKAQFNWAANATESFSAMLSSVASASGTDFTLPKSISTAMDTFSTVTKWTEVVFIIAYIGLGAELLFGIFANCSRAFSCVTFIVATIATVAVCAAAALATAMAAVVVGVVEGTGKLYGVKGSINTNFLAAVWIGAAFAIAAELFWMFTICCCKPDHNSSRGRAFGRNKTVADPQGEKMLPIGAYQPLHEPEHAYGHQDTSYGNHQAYNAGAPQYPQTGRNDMAYEPYSHRA